MRNALLLTVIAALPLLAGCVADTTIPDEPLQALRFSVKGASLPSIGEGVGSLDLLAFRSSDGVLCARERFSGGDLAFSLPRGKGYTVYLFANAPEGLLDGLLREGDLKGKSLLLSEDDPAHPVMGAWVSVPSGYDPGKDGPLAFSLRRYLSKVTVGDVTVRWLEDYPSVPTCTVSRMALMSAKGSVPLVGAPSAEGEWHNCGTLEPVLPGVLSAGSTWPVTGPGATRVGCSLYAMPNPSDGGGWGLPWSVRKTRIAIELTIQGVSNWYPVDLPAMESGCEYLVSEVVITGPGADGPDEKIERSKIEISLEVRPWETETITMDFE